MQHDGEQPNRLNGHTQEEQQAHVALDGKTLRGTLGHVAADQKQMHQLTLYDTQTGVLLKEHVTGEKQNELSTVSEFLTPVLVKGRIISADALHTQHAFCFSEPPHDCRDWRRARSVNKGHGRLEIRAPGGQYRTE